MTLQHNTNKRKQLTQNFQVNSSRIQSTNAYVLKWSQEEKFTYFKTPSRVKFGQRYE